MERTFVNEIEPITEEWILGKMEEFNLKRTHLTADLRLTAHYLSLLFASEDNPRKIGLSRPMRTLFYYYFKTLELKRGGG